MIIPEGMTEKETLHIIEKVANKLASKIIFGYNSKDDIRQEVSIFCLEGLKKFVVGKGTLYSFLLIYAKRELLNAKRKSFERIYSECKHCTDGTCQLCFKRVSREEDKKALFGSAADGSVPIHEDDFGSRELLDKIDKNLPPDLRPVYLKMMAGHTVSQSRKQELRKYIEGILNDNK